MATITSYQLVSLTPPSAPTDIMSGMYAKVNLVSITPPSAPTDIISGINPNFSTVSIGTITLASATNNLRTGLLQTVVDNGFGSFSNAVPTIRKLRGWHTVNAVYMYWGENASTPTGVDTTSIVVVGII